MPSIRVSPLVVVWLLGIVPLTFGQTEVDVAGGAAFGWPQDVTVETRDSRGNTILVRHQDSLPVQRGEILQLGLSRWSRNRPSAGISVELVDWRNSLGIATSPTKPPRCFREEHIALMAYLTGRIELNGTLGGFLYGGLGGGLVGSTANRSRVMLGPTLSILVGFSLPLGISWRASLEGRYLITRDFDALVRDDTSVSNLEFSGHPSLAAAHPILGPHMDSRFGAILLGVRWSIPRHVPVAS